MFFVMFRQAFVNMAIKWFDLNQSLFNSQADDCADLQNGVVFRYFLYEEVTWAIFNHSIPPLNFHEKPDFHSFRANKSTERKFVLSLSLFGKVP